MTKQTITIDGACFETLTQFFAHFQEQALDRAWGHNLDAFNDVLRGGFGTPEDGFILRWKNHHLSRSRLGHAETARVLRARLQTCHASNSEAVRQALAQAEASEGETIFDTLVTIIKRHGPGGREQEDGVQLHLD